MSDVNELAVFPFIDTTVLQQLKTELPQYVAACASVAPSYDVLKFWQNHLSTLPYWSTTAAKVVLLQPSSAASERVFSVLKASFSDTQTGCLQDLVECSCMLQYNNRDV